MIAYQITTQRQQLPNLAMEADGSAARLISWADAICRMSEVVPMLATQAHATLVKRCGQPDGLPVYLCTAGHQQAERITDSTLIVPAVAAVPAAGRTVHSVDMKSPRRESSSRFVVTAEVKAKPAQYGWASVVGCLEAPSGAAAMARRLGIRLNDLDALIRELQPRTSEPLRLVSATSPQSVEESLAALPARRPGEVWTAEVRAGLLRCHQQLTSGPGGLHATKADLFIAEKWNISSSSVKQQRLKAEAEARQVQSIQPASSTHRISR